MTIKGEKVKPLQYKDSRIVGIHTHTYSCCLTDTFFKDCSTLGYFAITADCNQIVTDSGQGNRSEDSYIVGI